MSTRTEDAQRTVVALLTAVHNHDPLAGAAITAELDRTQCVLALIAAVKELHHEMRLACAEAGLTFDDVLAAMGLACAERAT